ncbi:MAG: ABC transporter ATP-binding protein [Candidatus Riflebacteria bacterium]|nr:ABC transporter ATP-binding protein [Candidatus Riflebacteria bacterium]
MVAPEEISKKIFLEGKDLKKSFFLKGKEIKVFDRVNFSFENGKVIVIQGRSGVGKSTLLSLLGGLDRPTEGSISFEGTPFENCSNEELALLRRRKIGIIFQNFNLLSSWTAAENVEAVLMHSGVSESVRRQKVEALLSELGLADRLDNLPSELSVGQQQRVAIARTLANDPVLILADEPTGDVDPETAKEIIEKLLVLVKNKGTTLIVATHGNFSESWADQIYQMKDGGLEKK